MHKYLALAAVAATALLASSANASDLRHNDETISTVRVPVAGKTDGQVREDIRVAATTVCRAAEFGCFDQAVADAERQFHIMRHPAIEQPRVEPARNAPLTVRLSTAGKTRGELLQEIDAAAHRVCQPMAEVPGEYQDCVAGALSSARDQLRHMSVASAGVEKLAQN